MTLAVIIPVFNADDLLRDTLLALSRSTRLPDEIIVIDDGSSDHSASVAQQCGARVVVMPHQQGPAICRNHAALLSSSDILVFLDADTCVHPDTLERFELHLLDPTLAAVIGSYDDTPRDRGILSQYRNLAHCYVHHAAHRAALTFWSGCGAVRRDIFVDAGGFDERYPLPSIEDIELGYRLTDHGARILLDPEICVTHTKHWTVWSSIRTDIFHRGIPWMVLLLERGRIPDDLNITLRHRLAAALTAMSLICLAGCRLSAFWLFASAMFAALALSLDARLLQFLYRKGGPRLLAVAAGMTLVQNICKIIATAAASLLFVLRFRRSNQLRQEGLRSQTKDVRETVIPLPASAQSRSSTFLPNQSTADETATTPQV